MKTPKAVTQYMAEFDHIGSEDEMRAYILDQMQFFHRIQHPNTSEAGWLAFKMGCTVAGAERAIRWAGRK